MTESESVALPFGDSPMFYFVFAVPQREIHYSAAFYKLQVLFLFFLNFFKSSQQGILVPPQAAKAHRKIFTLSSAIYPKT